MDWKQKPSRVLSLTLLPSRVKKKPFWDNVGRKLRVWNRYNDCWKFHRNPRDFADQIETARKERVEKNGKTLNELMLSKYQVLEKRLFVDETVKSSENSEINFLSEPTMNPIRVSCWGYPKVLLVDYSLFCKQFPLCLTFMFIERILSQRN